MSSTILNALLNLLNLQGRAGGTARGEREDERSGSQRSKCSKERAGGAPAAAGYGREFWVKERV